MAVRVEHEVVLSLPGTALTYSLDAQRTLEPGGPGYTEFLAAVHRIAHQAWHSEHIPLTAYVSAADAPGSDAAALFVALVPSDAWSVQRRDAVHRCVEATDLPWRSEGLRPCLPEAIPVITVADGSTWHLWHERGDQCVVCFYTLSADNEVEMLCEPAQDTDPTVFPESMQHARVVLEEAAQPEQERLPELMRVAWTLHYAEQMIEVDGHADDAELALLSRTFPERRLAALGLADRATCVRLRTLAHTQLATLLSETDRMAMLGLLFRLAQADGSIVPAETALLREACTVLGLDWTNAQRVMLERWG